MKINGFAQTCIEDLDAFEPASSIYWLGDAFLWAGSLKCGNKPEFALIRKRPSERAEILAPLRGPGLCRQGADAQLYALGLVEDSTVEVAGPCVQIRVLYDNGRSYERCSFALALERERLERAGVHGLTSLAIGRNSANQDGSGGHGSVLACRPTLSREESELLLFQGGDVQQSIVVDWPLALDNPVLFADPLSGDWLVYPSLQFVRRQAFKTSLPGIPVCRVSPAFELCLSWVPWGEWNESGPYRFFPFGSGLIGATSFGWTNEGERLSGIYFPDDNRWVRRFGGQVEVSSLAVSADLRYLAWSEQIKVEPHSAIYGKLRQVIRIASI